MIYWYCLPNITHWVHREKMRERGGTFVQSYFLPDFMVIIDITYYLN